MKIKAPKKNKSDLLKKFLKLETDLNPKINEALFNKFFENLETNISNHITIELRNFGIFKSKYMNSRYGSDPRNKKKIYIPPKWKVTFKVSDNINKKLNEKI